MSERDVVIGRRYRSAWSSRLLVEVVDTHVQLRLGALRCDRGVLYRRVDKLDQPLAVRSVGEFLRTFAPVV